MTERQPLPQQKNGVIVAGHICLDIIPTLDASQRRPDDLFKPGRLVRIGGATVALGGAVSNTGLALHRLGVTTTLMGRVGDDALGRTILDIIGRQAPELADGMIVAPGESSSYTVVISPPSVDRCFLHCTGANDTFPASEIDIARASTARLLHFGYPPLMRCIYEDGGAGLASVFGQVQASGTMTSLDMAMPDPASPAGQLDWDAWLRTVLPMTDIFLPSFDEVLMMQDRPLYDRLVARAIGDPTNESDNPAAAASIEMIELAALRLLEYGARVVVLKLGDQGLYLRTSDQLPNCGQLTPDAWRSRRLLMPCFDVPVVGATGSGDCTIAGLLTGLVKGLSPEQSLRGATGVGACNVQVADSVSGIPDWKTVQRRLELWEQKPVNIPLDDWRYDEASHAFCSPDDRS